jgi:type VI secretion system protein ImpA
MATPDILDFEALLSPLSDESPTGIDIRADDSPTSPFYAIKDARNEASRDERIAEREEDDAFNAERAWRPVTELAPKILTEVSKDLEVVAWYIEALLRTDGFAGLRDGFRLAREISSTFWDDLYPRPDEEGLLTRVYPITRLNGEGGDGLLILPIRKSPITEGQSVGPFASWQFAQALELDQLEPEKKEQRLESGATSREMFDSAIRETGLDFFRDLRDDISGAIEEFELLSTVLDEKCGVDSPPSANIREVLQYCQGVFNEITRDLVLDAVEESPEAESGGGGQGATAGGPTLSNRDEAFQTLLQVSEYFRKAEPHSPISYALKQAVRWGRMPLPELMSELIPDETARGQLFRLTGIKSTDETND